MNIKTKILLTVSAVAGLAVSFFVYKKIKRSVETKTQKDSVKNANVEYKELINKGQSLSNTDLIYSTLINELKLNFEGCETFDTEINSIISIIKVVKKPVDYYYLVNKANVLSVSDCGSFGLSKTDYDLVSLLKDQLDSSGFVDIDLPDFKFTGWVSESVEVLEKYFKTLNISF